VPLCIKHSTRRAVPWGRGCRDGRLRIAALVNGRALSLSLERERELSSVTLNTEPHPLALSLSLSLSLSRSLALSLPRSLALALSLSLYAAFFFLSWQPLWGRGFFQLATTYILSLSHPTTQDVFFLFFIYLFPFLSVGRHCEEVSHGGRWGHDCTG